MKAVLKEDLKSFIWLEVYACLFGRRRRNGEKQKLLKRISLSLFLSFFVCGGGGEGVEIEEGSVSLGY
ncbi:hypothetical protein SADUNF_Sadunf08G0134700 [Salix dunnii]|uniref:Uncharacterized protein n=1 Tax=Salix dunnii TaxID=1413687 RepID=A0A835K2Z9_9ROSI|nr:hypothetical protein SADUNF_Sadunf08G0134700 [Salix dunnii]